MSTPINPDPTIINALRWNLTQRGVDEETIETVVEHAPQEGQRQALVGLILLVQEGVALTPEALADPVEAWRCHRSPFYAACLSKAARAKRVAA
ncbi:hypothetical protein [Nocardioides sp. KR10-350]|uniref:hypothetical protein n=1 Tax=Nocardioides cheoyonin TaxID=3156615 RepID=UPI0032B422F2